MGRVTDIIYPTDTDSLDYAGGTYTRTSNPTTRINYSDVPGAYYAEETDSAGAVTRYVYDDFGQLVKVAKFNQKGLPEQPSVSEIAVSYNLWGEIAKGNHIPQPG